MPQYKVEIPGQGAFKVESPEPLTDEQAYMAALRQIAPKTETPKPTEDTEGFLPALKAGTAGAKGSAALLAGKLGLMSPEAAEAYNREQEAYGKSVFTPTQKSWGEAPGTHLKELLGGSLPYMAAPVIGGLVAPEAAALGALGLTAGETGAGLASLAQFTGTNLGRQVEEGKSLKEANLGYAAASAVPQAILDTLSLKMLPGIRGIFSAAGKEIPDKILEDLTKQGLLKTIGSYTAATGKAMGAEGLTEAAQQFFERLQAGLSINDAQARDEYWQNLIGGAALGGALAPMGHMFERAGQQRQFQAQQPAAQPTPVPAVGAAQPAQQPLTGEEQIPEPTVRAPEEPVEALKKLTKDQERKINAERMAYLKKYAAQAASREAAIAEYQRVKDMTPEEFAAEQMQGIAKVPKAGLTQEQMQAEAEAAGISKTYPQPHEEYAARQIALAKDREPAPNWNTYTDYLMQDPVQAKKLVDTYTQIPGLPAAASDKVLRNISARLEEQAAAQEEQRKAAAKAGTAASKQRLGSVEEEERAALQAQREEEARAAQAAEQERRITPEVLATRNLGQGPASTPYRGEPKKMSERRGLAQEQLPEGEEAPAEDETVNKLIQTLPLTNGKITPGDVYLGLGTKKNDTRDLQAQLAVARMTRNKPLQEEIKRKLNETRAIPTEGGLGTEGGKTAAEFIARSKAPELLANEAEADKFASEQRSTLLGLAKLLASTKIMLPAKRTEAISNAKETYIAQHAAEIEARRKAFGLPPMEDWERAEARARALEGLNTLTNNWGQFEDPVISVKALQNITREAVYQNLYKAAQRKNEEISSGLEEKLKQPKGQQFYYQDAEGNRIEGKGMEVPRQTGPRIGAPDELALKGMPRRSFDEKQDAQDMVEMALTRKTRVAPTDAKRAAAKVGDLASLEDLFTAPQHGGKEVAMEPATLALLQKLQDALPSSTDPEFHKLAREQAQQIVEGNQPSPNAVRELIEMMKAQEEAGRSETRPGATPEELQRTSAQPQRDLFPEAAVQTQRATPSNFQKMLDSKNVQGMRDAIEKQRQDNIAALQAVGKALPTAKNKLAKAEANHKRAQKKAEAAGTEAYNYVDEYKTDLHAAQDVVVELRDQIHKLEDQLKDVELVKEVLATEPTDMRFLINAPTMLAQEKPLRAAIKASETALANAQAIVAAIEADFKSLQTLVVPAQKRAEAAAKEAEKTKEELAAARNEANQERAKAERAEQREKDAEKFREFEGTVADINEQARLEMAQQRGREGMDLPGIRHIRDTASIKEDVADIRRKLGSKRAELEKREKGLRKNNDTGALRAEIDSLEDELSALYGKTQTIKTEITTAAEARAEREREDARMQRNAAADAEARKKRKEPAPKLAPTNQSALMVDTKTGQITQPRKRVRVVEPAEKITDKLLTKRAELAETQRRIDFLKANGKDKVKGRKTDLFKSLEEKAATQRAQLDRLSTRQQKFAAVETGAEVRYNKQQERQMLADLEKETDRFARGVETESPDLSADQVSMLEKNDITAALDSFADDANTSTLNKVIAQRLAAMLGNTNVELTDKLVDENGKPVLGSATESGSMVRLSRKGGLSQEILLHEGTHAATERVIVQFEKDPSKLSEVQRVAVRELQALHKAIQNDPRITSATAKGSLSEFVAEVFSNKNLQEQMRSKKWRLSDAWKGFKSIILRMLGIKDPETMLGAALQSVDAILTPTTERAAATEETTTARRLSQKDIAALHDGSNSMKQFAEQFGDRIKQKDRTPEDANRIGQDYLQEMAGSPTDYVAQTQAGKLPYDLRMSDGKTYDPKNLAHFFEATPQTIMNYEALNNEALREAEAEEINTKRVDDLRALIDNLEKNPEYTYIEQALVAKAAAKFAVLSDKYGKLRLAEIAADNRHPIAVVGTQDAARIIEELRAGKPLKQAFLDGLQKNADVNAKDNARKNGWQKFKQSDSYKAAVDLNAGAANTSWCTGANVTTAANQIKNGDFYIYYADGKPEVAVRMIGSKQIGEIRGNTVNQSLTPQQLEITQNFLTANSFAGADTYLSQMARKDALAKAFRDDTVLPVDVLYSTDPWVEDKYSSNGVLELKVNTKSVYNFTNFTDIEGEIEEHKPEAPKGYERLVRNKLVESLKTAFKNDEFPGVSVHFFGTEKFECRFEGSDYAVSADKIKGATQIAATKKHTFSNLNTLQSLMLMGSEETVLQLPKVHRLAMVSLAGEDAEATVVLPKGSVIGEINGSVVNNGKGKKVTIEGVETVGNIRTWSGNVINLFLPDAKYVPEIPFNRREAEGHAVDAAHEKFDDALRSAGLFDAFVRYSSDRETKSDIKKAEQAQDILRKLLTDLTGSEQRADSIITNTSIETVHEEPEPIRWKVPAAPAFKAALLPTTRRVTNILQEELGRAPTEAEIEARFDEMYAERDRLLAERRVQLQQIQQQNRTLSLTPTQRNILAEEEYRRQEPFESDEEKETYLNEYYSRNPGQTITKMDPYGAIRFATYEHFAATDNAQEFADKAKKFNSAFDFKAGEKRATDAVNRVNAPLKIADAPYGNEGFTQAPEQVRYARAAAPGFESALKTADDMIAKPKTVRQVVEANLGLAFRTQVLDRLAPLEKIATDMLDPLKGMQMMHYLRMADQKMSFVQQAVARGVPQIHNYTRKDGRTERIIESRKGANLANVVNILKDAPGMNAEAANKLFTLYLAAKRGDRVGYDVLNTGASEADIKSAVADIQANAGVRDVFERAREEYNKYNRDLVEWLRETGVITPDEADRLAKTNDYIPYYREQNGNAVLVIGGEGTFTIGNLADQPQLRQLIGGDQKILDFLTSSVQNTSMLVDMGLRNQAAKNAMYELVDLKLAHFLGKDTARPDVVRFKDKGVDKFVQVATEEIGIPADLLVKGMEGIPVNNSAVVKALAMPATFMRRAVTVSPLYAMRQVFRDSVAANLTSGANITPVFGALKQVGHSATRETLESRGIVGGQVFTGTNEDLSRILGELQSGKMGIAQFVAKAEAMAMEADALTRRAQYESYIAQGLSEMEATMMSLESMNFNRKGLSPSVRLASTLIPFFNAQLQSLDVLYRAMTGKMPMNERLGIQRKLYERGLLLAGTAVAYALLMQDDETYKNANPDEKYGNFFVHVPGLKEAIRVPVPFEIGYIFKALPEAMVNTMLTEQGGEEVLKAFKQIAIQTVPGGTSMFMPAAVKPLVENVTNYSFYTGRSLETKSEQMEQAQYRFRDNTSEVAKALGAAFGASPIKIENLIRGYTGGMGLALTQAVSTAMPTAGTPEAATKRLSDTAVIGPLFQPTNAGGIVSAVYDRMNEIKEVKVTYDRLIKEGRTAEAREFMQKNTDAYAMSAVSGNVQQQLTKITQAMNAVKASNMSPDEKRERLDALQNLRIKIAENMREVLRQR